MGILNPMTDGKGGRLMKSRGRSPLFILAGITLLWLVCSNCDRVHDSLVKIANEIEVRREVKAINRMFEISFHDLLFHLMEKKVIYSFAPVRREGKRFGVLLYGSDIGDDRIKRVYECFGENLKGTKGVLGDFDSVLMEAAYSEGDRLIEKRAISQALQSEPELISNNGNRGWIWRNPALHREALLLQGGDFDFLVICRKDALSIFSWFENEVKAASFVVKSKHGREPDFRSLPRPGWVR